MKSTTISKQGAKHHGRLWAVFQLLTTNYSILPTYCLLPTVYYLLSTTYDYYDDDDYYYYFYSSSSSYSYDDEYEGE